MARPQSTDFPSSYSAYVSLVPEEEIVPVMTSELGRTSALLSGVSDRDASICHPPFTWTLKQVVGHLIDTERIFAYRALCFARGDIKPLPGFDESHYAQTAGSDERPLIDLAAEFEAVRKANLCLFRSLSTPNWLNRGLANGNEITVLALAYAIVGHERHHTAILRRRLARAD
jgi:hypothetical protein